ncbi:cytochrome c oxidase subunit 3 [Pareuzebyella sediminis]|uniref:cytochrome c oxidase subunit 3 n=1 Tax=Pareuzebyella sediminis TaxID=2607998 RepID=UPI0011EE36B0|nr:cytochrome c oxidase subunit 3 [Pareuzebyella sediminis]
MKDKGKLLILLLVGSETFFFISLIIAYVYYRNFTNTVDTVAHTLDATRAGIFTLFLIASSVTLIVAKNALKKDNRKRFKIFLVLTVLLGVIFISGQIGEYIGLYKKQITLDSDVFGSSFFTLTGFHGLHVILGLIALTIIFLLSIGKMERVGVAAFSGMDVYWHFVDVVWIFVFYFVYIMPLL